MEDFSVNKLRLVVWKFIRLANPDSFLRSHGLRKMTSSYAFFRQMDVQEIYEVVGGSSILVFRRHYLKGIEEVSSSLVVLGSEVPASVKKH